MSSFKLKLFRDDIAIGAIPEVSEDSLISTPVVRRRGYGDLVNDVRVNYALRCSIPIPSIIGIGCDDIGYTVLLSDGTIWSAGIDSGGFFLQGVVVGGTSSDLIPAVTDKLFTKIFRHWEVCGGLDAGGQAWFWGDQYGQWGCGPIDPLTCPNTSPIAILGGGGYSFSDFSVSYPSSAGVTTGGKIYGQGQTWPGMSPMGIGDLPYATIRVPTQEVLGKTDWVSVFCGWMKTMAIDSSGRLWGTGINTDGQLGLGDINERTQFTQEVLGKTDWTSVDIGEWHTIALDASGRVWVTGYNGDGALGDGIGDISTFTQVDPSKYGNKSVVAVCADAYTSFILCGDGTLYSTGSNWEGQCGLGHFDDPVLDWTVVLGDSYTMIDASNDTVMGVKSDNTIWYWGYIPWTYGETATPTQFNWPRSPFI